MNVREGAKTGNISACCMAFASRALGLLLGRSDEDEIDWVGTCVQARESEGQAHEKKTYTASEMIYASVDEYWRLEGRTLDCSLGIVCFFAVMGQL